MFSHYSVLRMNNLCNRYNIVNGFLLDEDNLQCYDALDHRDLAEVKNNRIREFRSYKIVQDHIKVYENHIKLYKII